MTLQEWQNRYHVSIVHNGDAIIVYPTLGILHYCDAIWKLFHLTDYVVSAARSGPSYWLVARQEEM